MAKQFTLGRTERLKSQKAIDALFEKGKSFSIAPFRVLYLLTEKSGLQFGVGVSSRNFKKAVDRNLIKRRMREAYRLQHRALKDLLRSQNKGMDLFFTYTAKEMMLYAGIAQSMQKCIEKLQERSNENPS